MKNTKHDDLSCETKATKETNRKQIISAVWVKPSLVATDKAATEHWWGKRKVEDDDKYDD